MSTAIFRAYNANTDFSRSSGMVYNQNNHIADRHMRSSCLTRNTLGQPWDKVKLLILEVTCDLKFKSVTGH
jgi:hypothetical protein